MYSDITESIIIIFKKYDNETDSSYQSIHKKNIYYRCKKKNEGRFLEAESFDLISNNLRISNNNGCTK